MKINLSIIIPAFNEQGSVKKLLDNINSQIKENNFGKVEIIFVDDGSTDNTKLIVEKWFNKFNISSKLILFRTNRGKSSALNEAFKTAEGDIVITMDADLQDDPNEIKNFILKINEGYDFVSGWKFKRKDPLSKTLPSKLFNYITSKVSGIKLNDFNCGFKAYKNEVVKDLNIYGELHRYIPIIVNQLGYKFSEIQVNHNERKFDKSKFGNERYLRGFLDLLTILFLNNYRNRPLHLFGSVGLVFIIIGLIVEIHLVLNWFAGIGIGNRPLLFFGMLLIIVGVQSFFFGFIGEMLVGSSKEKVSYKVKKFNE